MKTKLGGLKSAFNVQMPGKTEIRDVRGQTASKN